ncbi:MAG: UDP-N-acetylmuramoyl-L-alanyl-D-glutamate--2,6-diaminopimelate ligase [bacterium]|nr:UDP-N-acetylmuramoyl-L-alanyl-D-glutamate--2,6-diaminopimelate ligase [bacterium]
MLDQSLATIRKFIPKSIYSFFQPLYHWKMAFISACLYSFPSRQIKVIGVTGTKGKSSTTEIINVILEEAGYKTAVSNTIRFKIADASTDNMYKMSMPGRFFVQRFLRKAVEAKCDFAVMEMTSQGSMQYRHKFIELDCFVFTNLSPEHIESHGSYEKYAQAKANIACEMIKSKKTDRTIIVNGDDAEAPRFLACEADKKISYGIKDAEPHEVLEEGIDFTFSGQKIHSPLSGLFNLYNLLAGITCTKNLGISDEIIIRVVEKFSGIKGRVEKIEAGQDFTVVVDYAHTADSMEKLYQAFGHKRKICVFGATGGGRDTWKRKEMGRIADMYCDEIILTDDDSYDENPEEITATIAEGIANKKSSIIVDRRQAIAKALKKARPGDAVLITGKGTDPYLMGPNGTKTPWSDAEIAREELEALH